MTGAAWLRNGLPLLLPFSISPGPCWGMGLVWESFHTISPVRFQDEEQISCGPRTCIARAVAYSCLVAHLSAEQL